MCVVQSQKGTVLRHLLQFVRLIPVVTKRLDMIIDSSLFRIYAGTTCGESREKHKSIGGNKTELLVKELPKYLS
jgi:hypothetical protein